MKKKIIIKGLIDAGARGLKKINLNKISNNEIHLENLKKLNQGAIIQKFIPEIENGEYSFVFFKENFSHSFLKIANLGDIRVQTIHGGKSFHFNLDNLNSSIEKIKAFRHNIKINKNIFNKSF